MARSVDQVVRDTIGNQAVSIIQLQAQLEAIQEELDKLKESVKVETKTEAEA